MDVKTQWNKWNMKRRWPDLLTLLLGTWLVVSAFILPKLKGNVELFNDTLIVGALVQLAAIAALFRPNAWKEWVLVVLGAWSIASSYLFNEGMQVNGLDVPLGANLFIVGCLILIGATFRLYRRRAILDMDRPLAGLDSHK